jgi:glyoxylase-like metal-dependent hydrolase (beta-lactamase superfamily II)
MPLWRLENADARPLVDGQQLEFEDGTLNVVHCPGHTMGSICLEGDGLLFSGDHVLRGTSPNVGGGDMRSRGMLGHFISSLRIVRHLGDDVQVFPGHGEAFYGLSARCSELLAHHEQRLDATEHARRNGAETVFEVAVALFGELEDFHVVLGCAEANAHLEQLVDQGRITGAESGHR